jgi:hypothetical protein
VNFDEVVKVLEISKFPFENDYKKAKENNIISNLAIGKVNLTNLMDTIGDEWEYSNEKFVMPNPNNVEGDIIVRVTIKKANNSNKEEKKYLLVLKEELELNIKILNDYINYAKANNLLKIDTRNRRNLKFVTNTWERYKTDIIIINGSAYAEKLMDIYRMFFMIDNTYGYVPIEAPEETLDKVNRLLKDINIYINTL